MNFPELSVVYWEDKGGCLIEENYNSPTWSEQKHSFGCFNSQVLVDRADVSDFHVSRTSDSWNVLVKRNVKQLTLCTVTWVSSADDANDRNLQ